MVASVYSEVLLSLHEPARVAFPGLSLEGKWNSALGHEVLIFSPGLRRAIQGEKPVPMQGVRITS